MIGKNVALNDIVAKGHGARMIALCRYLDQLDLAIGKPSPVVFHLNSLDPSTGDIEMQALSQVNPRARQPMRHMVHSWPAGEVPTPDQARAVAEVLLEECGLKGCLAKCSLQYNTGNVHLHVVVCTVDPISFRMRKTAFIEEALHRSCAINEHHFGWRPEVNARYRVQPDGTVVRSDVAIGVEEGVQKSLHERAARLEHYTGEVSAQRFAQVIIKEVLAAKHIGTWAAFHATLALNGLAYKLVRGGALLEVHQGATPVSVKASSVDRKVTLKALEKRFGPFDLSLETVRQLKPERVSQLKTPTEREQLWSQYQRERDDRKKTREAYAMFCERQKDVFLVLKDQQRAERESVFASRASKGFGTGYPRDVLNALRSVLAGDHAKARAALKEKQARERVLVRLGRMPSFNDWLALRQGEKIDRPETNSLVGETQHASLQDIRAYTALAVGSSVEYRREGRLDFVDHGARIEVIRGDSRVALTGALQLAAVKWPKGFVVRGGAAFKAAVVKEAVRCGVARFIVNPELQDAIRDAKASLSSGNAVVQRKRIKGAAQVESGPPSPTEIADEPEPTSSRAGRRPGASR